MMSCRNCSLLVLLLLLSCIVGMRGILVDSSVSSNGKRIVLSAEYTIPIYPPKVFKSLTNLYEYGRWFTDSKKIDCSDSGIITKVGDKFTESFGLFDSSSITWTVSDFKAGSKLCLRVLESKNTIAWDSIEVNFELEKPSVFTGRGFEETLLKYMYSYEISNPAFLAIERAAMREGVVNECLQSLASLESLVTGNMNVGIQRGYGPNAIKGSVNEGLTRVDQWYLPVDYKSPNKKT